MMGWLILIVSNLCLWPYLYPLDLVNKPPKALSQRLSLFELSGLLCLTMFYTLQIKMLEYRHNRLEMEPLMLTNVSPSNGNLDSLEFRRVRCKGVFDEKRSVFVGPRSRSISGVTENGYYVITPLLPIPNNTERYMLQEFISFISHCNVTRYNLSYLLSFFECVIQLSCVVREGFSVFKPCLSCLFLL